MSLIEIRRRQNASRAICKENDTTGGPLKSVLSLFARLLKRTDNAM